ncbi:MAG: hypothetical protein ACE5R4_05860 [Armatimonadota bacterium]
MWNMRGAVWLAMASMVAGCSLICSCRAARPAERQGNGRTPSSEADAAGAGDVAYSEPVDGLAIALSCPPTITEPGEHWFTVYLKNCGSEDVTVCLYPDLWRLILARPDGELLTDLEHYTDEYELRNERRADFVTLQPDWLIAVKEHPWAVSDEIAAGEYRIRAQLLPPFDDDRFAIAIEQDEHLKVWRGPALESSEATFRVP